MKKTPIVKTQYYKGLCLTITISACFQMCANATTTCGTRGAQFPNDVWCSTYSEVKIVDPISGSPVSHPVTIVDIDKPNCGGPNGEAPLTPSYNGSAGYSYQMQESISHSCTGSDTAGVGFSVGEKGVAEVSLSYATTLANGWEKSDTYSLTINDTWNYSVPPCQHDHLKMTAVWKDGTFKGKSFWRCTANNGCISPPSCFSAYIVDVDVTTSTASPLKKYLDIGGTSPTRVNCPNCGG